MADNEEQQEKKPFHIESVEALFTLQRSEDGVKIPVFTPTGEETDGFIHICGMDSKRYKKAQAAITRKYGDLSKDDIPDVDAKRDERDLDLAVAFVIGWTLPLEFTPDNVRRVLLNIPRLRNSVVNHGVQVELFFAAQPINS